MDTLADILSDLARALDVALDDDAALKVDIDPALVAALSVPAPAAASAASAPAPRAASHPRVTPSVPVSAPSPAPARAPSSAAAPRTTICFLCDAPAEDAVPGGGPYSGKAGELLSKMISAMGLDPASPAVAVTTLYPERPPKGHRPDHAELMALAPAMCDFIRARAPRVIVPMGGTPAQALLDTEKPINNLRGVWTEWEGIPVLPTFHPGYLLKMPVAKKTVWEDLKSVLLRLSRPD